MTTPKDIADELREISPRLLELKQAVRLPAVPDAYFDGFPEAVMERIADPATPVLGNINRDRKPAVPGNYFDTLADQVMQQIREEETINRQAELRPGKTHILIGYFRQLAVAATVLGIIALSYLLFDRQSLPLNDCEDGIACLTREEIRQYVQEHAYEFDAEQIHETFQPVIGPEAVALPVVEPEVAVVPVIDEAQIEQYIEENPAMIDLEDASTDIF